jgi:VWFA-related protein
LLVNAADRVAELPITTESRNANLIDLVSTLPAPDPAVTAFMGRAGPDAEGRAAIQKVKALEGAERMRALAAYEVLAAFCDALSVVEGRKAVVWVSSGVKLMAGGPYAAVMAAYQDIADRNSSANLGGEAVPGIREIIRGLDDPDDVVLERQRRLHETANSANVSIYAVDPTPLIEARTPDVDVRVGSGGFRAALSNPFVIRSLDALGDSLRNAAAATGGRAFVHATDLGNALQEIEADASRYYLLTYEPPRAEPDGAYHDVRVEVDRPDVRVRFRSGYRHVPAAERLERAGEVVGQLPGLAQPRSADARRGTPVAAERPAAPAVAGTAPVPLPADAVRLLGSWVRWDATRTSIAWGARLVNVTAVGLTVTLRVRFVDREGTVLGEDSHVIQELRPGSVRVERNLSNVGGALDAVHAGRVLMDYTALPSRD